MVEKGQNNSVKDDVNKSCKILIVEDDEGLSHLITKSLKNIGFDVGTTHNGTQAVDWVVNNPVDLMLLDYKLPDMSARQIIEVLKERKIEIPFIIMTGHGDEKIAVEMMKTGAKDYIVKEGNFLELLPLVMKRVVEQLATEKRLIEAEEAQRKSEERFMRVIENIFKFVPEGLLVFTDKLKLFKENKAFQDIIQKYSSKLNYTEEELTEKIIGEVKKRISNKDHTEIRISKKHG